MVLPTWIFFTVENPIEMDDVGAMYGNPQIIQGGAPQLAKLIYNSNI